MFNLAKAVTIVFVVLVLAMGFRTGLIIGAVLFITIMTTFLVMYMKGDLLMERVSLGALIIALCMLTDNAIIVIEACKVGIERGENKLDVVRDAVAQNQWPLFGATAIGILAFAAIGLSQDASGEVANSLFWVIFISLTISWISSLTITPLLSFLLFKKVERRGGAEDARLALDRAATLASAEMLGAADRVLAMTVEYAKTRQQFGRAIGAFQAVQHQCADMLLLTESARSATYFAAWALSENAPEAPRSVSMAKAYCSDAARDVCHRGVQVHGGIGFTWEHDLHLYLKRAKANEVLFGDATYHREEIARLVLDEATSPRRQ